MLDEYDMDGSGTIDFMEFMVLIYKIQRGVIDLSTSDFGRLLAEAKSQLRIFEVMSYCWCCYCCYDTDVDKYLAIDATAAVTAVADVTIVVNGSAYFDYLLYFAFFFVLFF